MKYICIPCGYLYDQEEEPSLPDWLDLPYQWQCPECGTAKVNFAELKIDVSEDDD